MLAAIWTHSAAVSHSTPTLNNSMKTPRFLSALTLAAVLTATGLTPHLQAADKNAANRAIMAYLGEAVPVPSDLDPKYTKQGLTAAFIAACKKAKLNPSEIVIDDSEFPFLIYASFSSPYDSKQLLAAIRAMPEYAYAGSVGGGNYIALNIVPADQHPHEWKEAIGRRTMIRLQVLAARNQ